MMQMYIFALMSHDLKTPVTSDKVTWLFFSVIIHNLYYRNFPTAVHCLYCCVLIYYASFKHIGECEIRLTFNISYFEHGCHLLYIISSPRVLKPPAHSAVVVGRGHFGKYILMRNKMIFNSPGALETAG